MNLVYNICKYHTEFELNVFSGRVQFKRIHIKKDIDLGHTAVGLTNMCTKAITPKVCTEVARVP